ncbi:SDR family oxidoreductase [candidate division KSB1 bacterium]|nr:SDR family oxidoreductase [candidate division KSB1 bacterium]MCH8018689.1 SDR family oxidoreductase [candidate division KSB1 bacterium]
MDERVALITGGARGIGRAIALSLADEGWKIAVCYRTSQTDGEKTLAEIRKRGSHGLAIRCDVSKPKPAEGLAKQVEREWGRIDAVINCAGPYHRINLLEETVEGWHAMFDNNLHPVFYLSRAVAPGMKARKWGRIISFSMANADRQVAQPQLTAHYIAKVGVLVLTRSLARLLAPHGITVNAISPGFINSGSAPEAELEAMAKKIPAGYIGSTQDVVSIVRFLLSDEACYINGANVHLSGGWGI